MEKAASTEMSLLMDSNRAIPVASDNGGEAEEEGAGFGGIGMRDWRDRAV